MPKQLSVKISAAVRPAAVLAPALALSLALPGLGAPPALEPPPPAVLAEARALVESMATAERGPYSRLRWYCNDGTAHPPQPYACAERGGGRQHAEYSQDRRRLSELGWSVGTIFAALSWEELWDGANRNQRLRELPLERYLVDIDDGWVLRRARFYRGRVQVEDEEAAGQALLTRLLANTEWLAADYLVARELARIVPHDGGQDRTRLVRRLSQELAERDPGFERLRIKIHTTPGIEDIASTRQWTAAARGRGAAADLLRLAEELAAELETLYGEGERWTDQARPALSGFDRGRELLARLESDSSLAGRSLALAAVRDAAASSANGSANLALLDLSLPLEREVSRLAFARLESARSRAELLDLVRSLAIAAYGSGFLSARERDALTTPLARLEAGSPVGTSNYIAAVRALRRAGPWATATVRFSFAEALTRYAAIDARALRFIDDLVRGSPLLPLAEATRRLTADVDELAGVAHRVFGATVGGTVGLNPGVATGPLRVVPPEDPSALAGLARTDIVVLPETVSELPPVAGILTLAEGNLLSHVQLLARNLGIPNASLTPRVARAIADRSGQEMLLAVGGDGSVVLEATAELPAEVRELTRAARTEQLPAKLAAPAPDLSALRPLPLAELRAGLAGRVVGPKAANLGELARLFPGRVEEAIALPFGIFNQHISAGEASPRQRLVSAFESFRDGRLDEAMLAAEVDAARRQVESLTLQPGLVEELRGLMTQRFGPSGSYGAFVRSDTNVEDLPGFTGAGLNLTVPNVVGFEGILAVIPRVWASAYSARSMAWRSTILERPEDVFTSVLLMKSVPADKSGVLVTADLATRGDGLTVACAWGVGGAVDGEAAETLVLRAGGSTLLVAEAKAPYRRRLRPDGGVEWVAASAGRVLTADEALALRRLAAEIETRLTPARGRDGKPLPWDVEFGFVDGRLTLFQIRPLVERGQRLADRVVDTLAPSATSPPSRIDLSDPLLTGAEGDTP